MKQVCFAIQSYYDCCDDVEDDVVRREIRSVLTKVRRATLLITFAFADECSSHSQQAAVPCKAQSTLAAAAHALKLVSKKCAPH